MGGHSFVEGTRGSRSVNPGSRSLPKRNNRQYECLLRRLACDLLGCPQSLPRHTQEFIAALNHLQENLTNFQLVVLTDEMAPQPVVTACTFPLDGRMAILAHRCFEAVTTDSYDQRTFCLDS